MFYLLVGGYTAFVVGVLYLNKEIRYDNDYDKEIIKDILKIL